VAQEEWQEPIPGEAPGDWAAAEVAPAPWPRASRAYLLVIALVLLGLGIVLVGSYRPGSLLVGAAVGLAASLRAVLPQEAAGMLAVRGRRVDTLVLAMVALAVIVLAVVVPPPSG
jgi:hypothetical protein